MKIESHIVGVSGTCARCGVLLPEVMCDGRPAVVQVGDRVGVITGLKFTEPVAYPIKAIEHDSNKLCTPKSVRDSLP